ncbi:MAG: 2TM domain-containing protein [Candidatus Dormiibacterota bacterium]
MLARQRLRQRRALEGNLIAWLVVSAVVIAIWATNGGGYFWPGWVVGPWALGLLLHAWESFGRRPITVLDVEREASQLRGPDVTSNINPEFSQPSIMRRHRSRW